MKPYITIHIYTQTTTKSNKYIIEEASGADQRITHHQTTSIHECISYIEHLLKLHTQEINGVHISFHLPVGHVVLQPNKPICINKVLTSEDQDRILKILT